MWGKADETELLPRLMCGLGATVVRDSPNGKFEIPLRLTRERKHGWRIAIQTLNRGKD